MEREQVRTWVERALARYGEAYEGMRDARNEAEREYWTTMRRNLAQLIVKWVVEGVGNECEK